MYLVLSDSDMIHWYVYDNEHDLENSRTLIGCSHCPEIPNVHEVNTGV